MWSAVVAGVTFASLGLVAPRYQSQAELVVLAKGTGVPGSAARPAGGNASDAATARMDQATVDTHVRGLLSRELGRRIVDDMKLGARPEFNPVLGAPDTLGRLLRLIGIGAPRPGASEQDHILDRFYQRLHVAALKDGRAITIRFTSHDPDLSAAVVNGLADAYRRDLERQSAAGSDGEQAGATKLETLKREVAEAEAAAETARAEADAVKAGRPATGPDAQQLAGLTAELARAQAAKSDAEARLGAARERMAAGSGETIPEAAKSPLMQSVVKQRARLERQIYDLSAKLLPGHPRMQQLNTDLAGLKTQIANEAAKIVEGLDAEAKSAALRVAALTQDIASLETRVAEPGPDEARLRQLQAEALSKRAGLERLQAEVDADRAKADSRAAPVEAHTISRARAATTPVFPRKGHFAVLAAVVTLLLGLALTIARALRRVARRTAAAPSHPAPVRARPDPVLPAASPPLPPPLLQPVVIVPPEPIAPARPGPPSVAPAAREADSSPAMPPPFQPVANTGVEVARVATIGALARRIASHTTAGGYRTLVAGESELLGVGSHATELGRALTDLGQSVILIDWSPEGEGVANAAGLPSTAGMAELLAGTATFEEVVKRLPGSEVHLIAAGDFEEDEAASPDPDRLNLVLDALDEAYDQIIVAARNESARILFETIEGRVDCGVLIADPHRMNPAPKAPPGSYLGFEVADIDLVRYDRQQAATASAQRLTRAGRATDTASRTG